MALNEVQRQSYLNTMGIQSYFPKFILPAAKASEQCDYPQLIKEEVAAVEKLPSERLPTGLHVKQHIEEAVTSEERPTAIDAPKSAAQILEQLAPNTPKPNVPEALPTESVISDNQSVENTQEVHFQLIFIRVNESLSVLNQIPYIGNNKLSATHQNLLFNILKALKLNLDQIEIEDLSFRWPLSEGQHIERSEEAAKQTLSAYLEQKHSTVGFKQLLVMGEMLESYVQSDQSLWQVNCTHSLDEMLRMPLIKRDVWQQLRQIDFNSPS